MPLKHQVGRTTKAPEVVHVTIEGRASGVTYDEARVRALHEAGYNTLTAGGPLQGATEADQAEWLVYRKRDLDLAKGKILRTRTDGAGGDIYRFAITKVRER
jgi:hypothetical protein